MKDLKYSLRKSLRYSLSIFLVACIWLVSFYLCYVLSRKIVRFLAFNLTDSVSSTGCCKFNWDSDLRTASYLTYFIFFVSIVYLLILLLNKIKNNALLNRFSLLAFIFIFPTYTSRGVASVCSGFGGCATGYHIDIIAPVIMSLNPINIAVSSLFAYIIARMFFYIKSIS
jgi:hypothetical protein